MLTVDVSPAGAGNVMVNGKLITSFPYKSTCKANVTLEAIPEDDYIFDGWSGDITGVSNPVLVTMDRAKSIVVNFRIKVPPIDL